MLKGQLHFITRKFEGRFGYDAGYLHEIIDVSPLAVIKFLLFQIMASHRQNIPRDVVYAAKLAATLCEDCGPCAQLVVNAALMDGIAPRVIAALLRGDLEAAGQNAELGFRYGVAVAQNTGDALNLSAQVESRFGKRGLISLVFAVACTRVYPALKRGLGHGASCAKITVAEETIVLKEAA